MELFQSVRQFWQTMGIKPPHPNQIHPFNARNLIFILSLTTMCASSMAFLLFQANISIEYGMCSFTSLSGVCMLLDVLITIWRMPIIIEMIDVCEEFIKMSEYWQFTFKALWFESTPFIRLTCVKIGLKKQWVSHAVYIEVIEKIEKMSKFIHFALFKMSFGSGVLVLLLGPMFNYFILDMGADSVPDVQYMYLHRNSWITPIKINQISSNSHSRLPFDYKTPFGFVLLTLLQFPWSFCLIFSAVPVICFLIGSCWLLVSFVKDIQNELDLLHTTAMSEQGRLNVTERFCNLVLTYSNVKQLRHLNHYISDSSTIFVEWHNSLTFNFQTYLDVSAISTSFMSLKFWSPLLGCFYRLRARS